MFQKRAIYLIFIEIYVLLSPLNVLLNDYRRQNKEVAQH